MQRRGSLRGYALRVSFAVALLTPAFFAGCGDDDSGGGIDAGLGGTGGTGTGGSTGTGGTGTGGMGSGGTGSGGTGSGGTGTGGSGTGGMMAEEDAGMDGGTSGTSGNGSDAGQATFRTVEIMMMAMTPHVDALMQFRIVSKNNDLVALGVLDPLPSASATFSFPHSTPPGSSSDFRLDFWADANDNRMYDSPPTDHQWREDVPATDPAVISFTHTTNFTDISMPTLQDGLDFTFNASGMSSEMNDPLELRVIDKDSKQLVGRYVLGKIAGATFSLKLPGIIQSGHSYNVDFFVDENGNGDYDAPPTDHAWRVTQDATASGLTVAFAHSTTYTDVAF